MPQSPEKPTVLVTGATGQQGGAAARHLLERGWSVRAMTRDPGQPAARELSEAGAEVVAGDLDDPGSLDRALHEVHGVFSVQTFFEAGLEGEVRQGRNLAEAARSAGVGHYVQASVEGAERETGIPHFETKARIEEHVRQAGLPATFLRPVFFMDNFRSIPDWRGAIEDGVLPMPLSAGTPLQLIAVDDIGAVAARVLDEPDRFVGEAVALAGDELPPAEIARVLSDAVGHPVEYVHVPVEEFAADSEDMAAMFRWFEEEGYEADIPGLRRIHPGLLDFETWADGAFRGGDGG